MGSNATPAEHSRRDVLNYARWAAVGVGVAGVAAALRLTLVDDSEPQPLVRSTFAGEIGTQFTVEGDGKRETLTLASVSGLPIESNAVDEGRFMLTFRGTNATLTQNTYRFAHARVRDADIFIVPTRDRDGNTVYEAIFNEAPVESGAR